MLICLTKNIWLNFLSVAPELPMDKKLSERSAYGHAEPFKTMRTEIGASAMGPGGSEATPNRIFILVYLNRLH